MTSESEVQIPKLYFKKSGKTNIFLYANQFSFFELFVSLVLFALIDTQTSEMCCFEKDVPFSKDIEKFRELGKKFYMLKFVYEIRLSILQLLKVLLMKIFFIKKRFMRFLEFLSFTSSWLFFILSENQRNESVLFQYKALNSTIYSFDFLHGPHNNNWLIQLAVRRVNLTYTKVVQNPKAKSDNF